MSDKEFGAKHVLHCDHVIKLLKLFAFTLVMPEL